MITVDANVAIRWSINMDGTEQAMRLLRAPIDLVAPDLILAELTNVFFKFANQDQITHQHAVEGLELIPRWFFRLVPAVDLRMAALQLALELRHPAYDCFYLALAEDLNTSLITTDERLIRATAKHRIGKLIIPLAAWAP